MKIVYHSQMGKDNNLVERQTFSSELNYRNEVVFTGSGTVSLSFLSLSLSLSPSLSLSLSLSLIEEANVSFAPLDPPPQRI